MNRRIPFVIWTLLLSTAAWAQNPAATVTVDVQASRIPISPGIYGINGGDATSLRLLNAPVNRYGGDRSSTYNWQLNADNHGISQYFESAPDTSATSGERGDTFFSVSKAAGAQPFITVPMLGWVANLGPNRTPLDSFSVAKYGAQTSQDFSSFPDAGNGILQSSGLPVSNNPNDANLAVNSAYQQQWIQHLVSTWGTAASGGPGYYILDNEPSLWYNTHRDVHPTGAKMSEILADILDYSGKIKSVDPSALVVGPEECSFTLSGYDQQYGTQHGWLYLPDRTSVGNSDYLPWLLQQLKQNNVAGGLKPIDVVSVHYYPTPTEVAGDLTTATQLLRNVSTRALWDPAYLPNGWYNSPDVIPQMLSWVNTYYYPGTPVALTEYSWGAENSMNGATAQADLLGIFGRQGLTVASRWPPNSNTPVFKAMQMYRNYDGANSTFGDVSISATVPNPDTLSAFAAQRSADGTVTVMVINKYLNGTTPLTLNLQDWVPLGPVQTFQLTSANGISRLPDSTLSGTSLAVTLPAQSVTLFVIPAQPPVLPIIAATPTVGDAALNVSFDASGSKVLTGTIASYTWNFGDGSTDSGSQVSHRYGTAGTYTAQLTVTSSTGLSASTTVGILANGTLLAPAGLTSSPGDKQATLQWNASAWATSYNVKRATTSQGPYATVSSNVKATNFVDSSLVDGTTYYYVVSAVNNNHESGNSNQTSVKPAATVRFEVESTPVQSTYLGTPIGIGDPRFSGGAGTYYYNHSMGAYITFLINVPDTRTYDVRVGLKNASNKGVWQLSVDSTNQGPPIDSYAAAVTYAQVDLGTVTFTSTGSHAFRITVVGKNPASSDATLSLDYIELAPR